MGNMNLLPMELILEILRWLTPHDKWKLTQAVPRFRQFLTRKQLDGIVLWVLIFNTNSWMEECANLGAFPALIGTDLELIREVNRNSRPIYIAIILLDSMVGDNKPYRLNKFLDSLRTQQVSHYRREAYFPRITLNFSQLWTPSKITFLPQAMWLFNNRQSRLDECKSTLASFYYDNTSKIYSVVASPEGDNHLTMSFPGSLKYSVQIRRHRSSS